MNEQENTGFTPEFSPETPAPQPVQPEPAPQPASQPAPQPAEKKPFPVKLVAIAAAALVVVILAAVLISSLFSGKPIDQIIKAGESSEKAWMSSSVASSAKALTENGSIGINADLSKLGSAYGMELPASVNLEIFTNGKNEQAALTVDAKLNNKTLADATLTVSKDELVMASNALLGKTNYGLSLKNLSKNLPKSILDPDQDTAYSLPEEVFETLTKQKDLTGDAKDLAKKAKAVAEEALEVAKKSISKNGKFTKDKAEVEFGEQTVKANAITLELDDKAIAQIATDLLNWAKKSKSLKNLLNEVVDKFGDTLEEAGMDTEEMVSDFYDGIADALDSIDDLKDMLEDTTLTAVFCISKSNKQLIKVEVTLKDDRGKQTYSLAAGPDLKEIKAISFSSKDVYGSKTSGTLTVEENTNKQFTAKLKVKGDTNTSGSFSWDKKEGTFKLSLQDALTLTGTITQKGKVTTIELKKLESDMVSLKNTGITITLNESAKFPSLGKYTELLTLKEDDLEDLMEDIQEAFGDLYGDVMGELY